MYSVSTDAMTRALGLDFLGGVAPAFFYASLAAWAAALIGLLRRLLRLRREAGCGWVTG
jgi:hypothetical protein